MSGISAGSGDDDTLRLRRQTRRHFALGKDRLSSRVSQILFRTQCSLRNQASARAHAQPGCALGPMPGVVSAARDRLSKNALDLALQNDFRVLVVRRYG
jgi:hypothetical protein